MNCLTAIGSFLILATGSLASASTITDLREWTLVEDPPNGNMSAAVVGDGSSATLTASGAVPDATDIGYQSVDGSDVAASTTGFYFSPASDFTVAIDFDVTFASSLGGGGFGFGIGEDGDGTDSYGLVQTFFNGSAIALTTAGRVGNADTAISALGTGLTTGRFFLTYDSMAGTIELGANAIPGSPTADPGLSAIANAIPTQWDGEPLLVSFFLRSDNLILFSPLTSGTVTAVFSNLEVLEGTPIMVPEPTAAILALLASWRFTRRLPRRR